MCMLNSMQAKVSSCPVAVQRHSKALPTLDAVAAYGICQFRHAQLMVVPHVQRDNLFYPSWAFQLPNMVLLQWPQAFVESLVWSVLA